MIKGFVQSCDLNQQYSYDLSYVQLQVCLNYGVRVATSYARIILINNETDLVTVNKCYYATLHSCVGEQEEFTIPHYGNNIPVASYRTTNYMYRIDQMDYWFFADYEDQTDLILSAYGYTKQIEEQVKWATGLNQSFQENRKRY